ncbi:aldehyde dehydrogenase family protein [Kineococcus rhizosphaerae]|uniref:Benzaldehyde dehydrogenase (NAD) n=1 Tax=Kineococcus rhizosphaerae TaxID=559628 RepID=A0A2T0QY94_9ACTN|nr:aldehyde dehydrogenase family protein [Kineococcus rhizosphaerae]PRY11173.1 benzaldehyde dehydrogenase (NAD) [Kineococcus rhizosphaerae]
MTFFEPGTWDGAFYSGGWRTGGPSAPAVEPATGAELGRFGVATPQDVTAATERAVRAQRDWAQVPAQEKAALLRRAGDLVVEHAGVLQDWLVREAGSGQGKAAFEAGLVAEEFHFAAGTAQVPYGQLLRSSRPRLSLAERVPVGVVGVISPFNFPGILAARSIAPALALGNAVVLKPDPRTAVAGGLFLAAVLAEAGLPDGLFHVLPGGADVGTALVEEPAVRVISFTGSTQAGRAVGAAAGRLLKRAHLELGGNNALVVLDDVDVEAAASAGAWGSFLHQGQICMTTGRHLVHERIHDEYVERLAAKASALPAGDPTTGTPLGPIIDAGQLAKVDSIVQDTVAAGARLAAGGTHEGLFYAPTVLDAVRPDHRAFAEEVFGPVAPVVSFSSLDDLVEIVGSSEYGLSLGILAKDAFAAYELSSRIPSGIVHINDQTVDDESTAPFGGVGASGTGARFGGHEGNVEAFTETRWVTVQSRIARYPF